MLINNQKAKIILIGGTAYSGSTVLDLMLSNAQNGFSCGEVNALFRPYRKHHFSQKCACGENDCDIWRNVLAGGECNLWNNLKAQNPKVSFFIDSSKDLVWLYDQNHKYIDHEHLSKNQSSCMEVTC